jgi:N-acetyl-gamma-glutamyl-phosphate reductase common form
LNREILSPRPRVGVVGVTGYVGSEVARWLLDHPAFELTIVAARSAAGKRLDAVVPALAGCTDLIVEEIDIPSLASLDAVFLATPHGAAKELAKALDDAGAPRIFDLSADHRLHPEWVYGLPEWAEDDLRGARRVAVPGCFASAIELALAPLIAANAIRPAADGRSSVYVAASTGSTGSGVSPSAGTHHPERFANFKAYKVLSHQHVAEIEAMLGRLGPAPTVRFVPHSAPVDRGILATCFAEVDETLDLHALYAAAYAERPLVRLRADSPEIRLVRGTAFCDIATYREGSCAVVISAIDNLGRGAAAQAIQCLNLSFHLPVDTGLRRPACTP